MNIKLSLQYDGTAYHGWQIQENAVTVQETVKNALSELTGEKINLIGCGRTDAGVHALDYTCNFHTETTIPVEKIPYALNSRLPNDIICFAAAVVPDGFHAKNSAVAKRYLYKILNAPFPDAFMKNYAWHFKYPLNLENMQKAAAAFLGEHDFIGFASSGFTVKTTVRTIYSLDVSKENNIITIDITGSGFLYNMVRIIAGTLAFAGSGKLKPEDMARIIASKDRAEAGITAPPQGLFLKEVRYR